MSWIDDELAKKKGREELCRHAAKFRQDVWNEIEARVDEVNSKATFGVASNGERVTVRERGVVTKTLSVTVGEDGCSVVSDNGKIFPLGLNGDSPALMEGDSRKAISIEEAARQILRPFLFGE
jgi:hypothetical protein